ncbi:GNAT family N-acetyltransferase [Mucilaginibacter sp.]|uniref:GNAT family N-acetyltransferase n=1 Tax=Mucilaginibacter sp. TaxID=1882438 RepID=UPI002638AD85|nr:GNAT family N-acetyltransferase [Mucilaginibacter sp.]MDB5030634.1 hypothetical protein [Mucilaginibacter sp.]
MGYFAIKKRKEWDSYVNRSVFHDIFHSWMYHSLNDEGESLLFVYQENDLFIALPVIKRKIEKSAYCDMTSVYGYCGPISNKDFADVSKRIMANFKTAFMKFMKEENAVCIFSRLHPFIKQQHLLESLGGVQENGTTLYMDLTISVEDQQKKYDKRLFRQIRKLREQGYTIKEATGLNEIKAFIDIYHKNMDRLNAASRYYLSERYFTDILDLEGYNNKLLLIYNGTELICGAIVLLSDNIIRNHLSATSPDYLKESPSKLLTDEISMIGRRLGKKIFHLGGGVSGKQDSLFMFKRYFSDLQVTDRIWCYINDHAAYNSIVAKAGTEIDTESTYFPLYRQPKRNTQPYISNIETVAN